MKRPTSVYRFIKRLPLIMLCSWYVNSIGTIAEARSNIVLMYVDNLGYGDLGCYGNRKIQSPRIDQFAKEGVRCTDFYVVAPGCTPSRGAILTGRYPLRNGLTYQLSPQENWTGIGLPHREKIISDHLKSAGYETACFGKWNIGFADGSRPTERGFDEFFGCRSGNIHYFNHTYLDVYDMVRGTQIEHVEGYSTDLFADAAVEFISKSRDAPYFLYLPFNAPHYTSVRNLISGGDQVRQWQVPHEYLQRYGWPADDDTELHRYLALLTAVDDAVGRVLDAIEAAGDRDNTLVMFISDMGAILRPGDGMGVASNAPFRGGAPSMYEGGVRVPAIFRWPGQLPEASVCEEMLSTLDILPLCFSAADLPVPRVREDGSKYVLDGTDPTAALAGREKSPHEFLTFGYSHAKGIRRGKYKMVKTSQKTAWELYDLSLDPAESSDLAKYRPEIVADLERCYQQWLSGVTEDASEPAARMKD